MNEQMAHTNIPFHRTIAPTSRMTTITKFKVHIALELLKTIVSPLLPVSEIIGNINNLNYYLTSC